MIFLFSSSSVQLKTLQGDFNLMRGEYDTLLELHKGGDVRAETLDSTTVQVQYFTSKVDTHMLWWLCMELSFSNFFLRWI